MELVFFLLISVFVKRYSTLTTGPVYSRLITKVHLKNAYHGLKRDINVSSSYVRVRCILIGLSCPQHFV